MSTQMFLKVQPNAFNSAFNHMTTRRAKQDAIGAATTSTASGTKIESTKTAGGAVKKFISPPVAFAITISGTVTFNQWAKEASTANNCGIRFELYQLSGGVETLIAAASFGSPTELTTTTLAKNWTVSPSSTVMAVGDCFVLHRYVVNVGTMGAGTVTFTDGGDTSGASGDSYVTLTETVTFRAEPELVQAQFGDSSSTGATFDYDNVAGNTILALVNAATSACSDTKGNTYALIGSNLNWNAANSDARMTYAKNIGAQSSNKVTPTASGYQIWIMEFADLDTTAPLDTSHSASGNSTNAADSTGVTPTAAVTIECAWVLYTSTTPAISTSGFGTAIGRSSAAFDFYIKGLTAAASQTVAFTNASQQWAVWMVSLKSAYQPGTTYTPSTSDTASATDAASAAKLSVRSSSDSTAATDTAGRTGSVWIRSSSDALTVSDVAAGPKAAVRTTVDSAAASDAAARALVTVRAASDSVAATDLAGRAVTFSRAASDTLVTSDSASRVLTLVRSASDSIAATDAAARAVVSVRSASDVTTAADSSNRAGSVWTRTASDTLGVSDTAAILRLTSVASDDTVSLADAAGRFVTFRRSSSDSATIVDSASAVVSSSVGKIPLPILLLRRAC